MCKSQTAVLEFNMIDSSHCCLFLLTAVGRETWRTVFLSEQDLYLCHHPYTNAYLGLFINLQSPFIYYKLTPAVSS